LKKELEGMRRALTRTAFPAPQWLNGAPDLSDAYTLLTSNEVRPELAREIVQCAEARLGGPGLRTTRPAEQPDRTALQRALIEELESRFTAEPSLGKPEGGRRIAAMVGPPGSGKTATLIKLAVNYGLACRRPVLLVSMDNYRIAAVDQLRSYAAILGAGFQAPETVAGLAQAIEECRGKGLVLIDTPGLGFGEIQDFAGLAQFLATRLDIEKHLVLSSSIKAADLTRMADGYEIFRPDRLLFTRLDETASFGPILNEAVRTAKPLSFFATGQRIPEDIEEATPSRLTSLILTGEAQRARTAA
jgi:flagellar biosynthesis protein FlhF